MGSGSGIVYGYIVADTTGKEDSRGVGFVFFGCGCGGLWGLVG